MKLKQLRVKVLEQVVKNIAQGHTDRADNLIKHYLETVGTQIVNEANWANHDDPMFAARREMQRELEDDMERNRVDIGIDDVSADGSHDSSIERDSMQVDDGECEAGASEIAELISQLITSGRLDDDKLEQILTIAVGGLEDDVEGDCDPGEEDCTEPTGDDEPIVHPNPDPDAAVGVTSDPINQIQR